MPIQLDEETGGKVRAVHVSGKLRKADYEHFLPEFERLVWQHGKLRVLFGMTGFHGWTAGALWKDTKSALHHFSDIDRVAVVGEKKWQARNGDLLQSVHESDGPMLRPHRRRRSAEVVGPDVTAATH